MIQKRAIPKRTDILTTGVMARMAGVAPRTVSKWFDSGKLKGYRIPGSEDRRVTRATFYEFLKTVGYPQEILDQVGWVEPTAVLAVGCGDLARDGWQTTDCLFAAGVLMATVKFSAVVIDASVGRSAAVSIASVRTTLPDFAGRLVWVAGEDNGEMPDGFDAVVQRPVAPDELTSAIAPPKESDQ